MGGSKEFFAQKLDELPEFEGAYQEHLTYYEELLGHVFFGEETLLGALERLLPANEDRARIRQYIDFVEDMYANGDDDVQNIVASPFWSAWGMMRSSCAMLSPIFPRS